MLNISLIINNLATIIVGGVLLLIVLLVLRNVVKNKKKGVSCHCNDCCVGCPCAAICHDNNEATVPSEQ